MAKSSMTSRGKAPSGKKGRESRKLKAGAASRLPSKRIKTGLLPKGGKIASIATMLRSAKGATIADLCAATGWQPHSVRAAISQTIKKKLGLDVRSKKVGATRAYRVLV